MLCFYLFSLTIFYLQVIRLKKMNKTLNCEIEGNKLGTGSRCITYWQVSL